VIALEERHSEIVEVPEDGAEGAKPSDTKDHALVVHWNGEAVHCERLLADPNGNIKCEAMAGHTVAIGDHDVRTTAVAELQPHTARSRQTDEVMSQARVQ